MHQKKVCEFDFNLYNRCSHSFFNNSTEDGAYCELCEIFLPIPVTYHMRMVHPGCGKKAKGKGYNSVGAYCEGWAGNCGEGGKGASSWYLMCDMCREKLVFFISIRIHISQQNCNNYCI